LKKLENGLELSAAEQARFVEYNKKIGLSESGTLRTQDATAKAIGITRVTLASWIKDGAPVEPDGTYDPDAILKWRRRGGETSPGGKEVLDKNEWDTRFRRAKALQAEVALKRDMGSLIERKLVVQMLVDRAIEFKKALLGLSRRVSLRVENKPAAEVQPIIDEAVIDILETYSRENQVTGRTEPEAEPEPRAAAKAKKKPKKKPKKKKRRKR